MLDIKYLREHLDEVKTNAKNRQAKVDVDLIVSFDEQRRRLESEIQGLRASRNQKSKTKPTDEDIAKLKATGDQIQLKEGELNAVSEELDNLMLEVPNLTHPDVKVSDDPNDNVVLQQIGQPTKFKFEPKDHLEIGEANLLDFERASKVTGSKFYYLKGDLVRLELALVNYALDTITRHGYLPMSTPDLAKSEIIAKLGFNPRGESTQVYNINDSELSLIGTAEITLGGYHQDEILKIADLPLKYVGWSHCYRTEAGGYSKFSKGLYRVHQFTKVEMFIYSTPHESQKLHLEMLDIEKEIFEGLEIPFRVIDHNTADLGNPSFRTYDLEAWLPGKPNEKGGRGDWAEVTSCSNCADYQARALNIKFSDEEGKKNLVHTLNGTGIAASRALIALMENHQEENGRIRIPKKLRPYLGGQKHLTA